jgi:hypothetical protein
MQNESDQIVFDPRGAIETEPLALSPRVVDVNGLRLGVLDNTKWNANRLLRKTVAKLGDEFSFASVHYYRKESFSKDADPALIETIAANNDIVLTAIGDWGSCTSCCTHDAIKLEASGRPTAVIVTTEFLHEAEVQRAALGMPELTPVVIEHPLSTLADEEIDQRAKQAATQAADIWCGGLSSWQR